MESAGPRDALLETLLETALAQGMLVVANGGVLRAPGDRKIELHRMDSSLVRIRPDNGGIRDAMVGAVPYVVIMLLFTLLLIAVPDLAVWLPSHM